MVFVPRKTTRTPAIVVELKWNQTAEAAITQIKRKQYVESLKDYRGEVILVGINYESKELKKDDYKKHSCKNAGHNIMVFSVFTGSWHKCIQRNINHDACNHSKQNTYCHLRHKKFDKNKTKNGSNRAGNTGNSRK